MTADTNFEPAKVNVRMKISALWAAMLFVFAYVDIFSLYHPDFRADVEAGEIGGFTINQSFLLGTTVYVVIPSLMVFGALVLRPRVNRIVNITLGVIGSPIGPSSARTCEITRRRHRTGSRLRSGPAFFPRGARARRRNPPRCIPG